LKTVLRPLAQQGEECVSNAHVCSPGPFIPGSILSIVTSSSATLLVGWWFRTTDLRLVRAARTCWSGWPRSAGAHRVRQSTFKYARFVMRASCRLIYQIENG